MEAKAREIRLWNSTKARAILMQTRWI